MDEGVLSWIKNFKARVVYRWKAFLCDFPLDHEFGKGHLAVPVEVHLIQAPRGLLLLVRHEPHLANRLQFQCFKI